MTDQKACDLQEELQFPQHEHHCPNSNCLQGQLLQQPSLKPVGH